MYVCELVNARAGIALRRLLLEWLNQLTPQLDLSVMLLPELRHQQRQRPSQLLEEVGILLKLINQTISNIQNQKWIGFETIKRKRQNQYNKLGLRLNIFPKTTHTATTCSKRCSAHKKVIMILRTCSLTRSGNAQLAFTTLLGTNRAVVRGRYLLWVTYSMLYAHRSLIRGIQMTLTQ